jgi:glycosyltransferase involved in cell wall biosynthesis
MQVNTLLSIVIPTYNRAQFLDYCLDIHIPFAKAHNILIVISDNASTDATPEVVKKRAKEYPLIQYLRNETNVGPDKNFELALKYPQTDYVWLLGDTYQITSEGIAYLLELVSTNTNKYDAIICNVGTRVKDIATQDYSNQNNLLSDLGWHMTCMSSLIFSSRLISAGNFDRYQNTNFIQIGVIFEQIANKEFYIHWVNAIFVKQTSIKDINKMSWDDQVLEVWALNWPNIIFSLPPSYKLGIKMKCIMDHGLKSHLFTLSNLRRISRRKNLGYDKFKQYSHFFPLTISYPKTVILAVALFPNTTYCVHCIVRTVAKVGKIFTHLFGVRRNTSSKAIHIVPFLLYFLLVNCDK